MIVRLTKNGLFILAISSFMAISVILYLLVDDSNVVQNQKIVNNGAEINEQKLLEKLDTLRLQVNGNQILTNQLNQKLQQLDPEFGQTEEQTFSDNKKGVGVAPPVPAPDENFKNQYSGGNKVQKIFNFNKKKNQQKSTNFMHGQFVCPVSEPLNHNSIGDVQLLNAYDVIPFDNLDGGVWKQGWKLSYDSEKIKQEKKLEVVIIPHSHNDPGWLKTFEMYFEDQTRNILDGMVKHLTDKPDMKFIYAEISFFELWWSNIDDATREKVKG